MRILHHPKRVTALGFETFCAPDDFDRTIQPVDIYDVFCRYYSKNKDAKWIFSVADATITVSVNHGTSYRYGYSNGGIDYVFDLKIETALSQKYNGWTTSINVYDTSAFPSSGTIMFENCSTFTYTSKTATSLIGPNRVVSQLKDETVYLSTHTISFAGTKKWVIVNHAYMESMRCNVQYVGPEWLYCGDKINSIVANGSTMLKYIHIHKLDNVTEYPIFCMNKVPLTGHLYISHTPTKINYGMLGWDSGGGSPYIVGELEIPSNIISIDQACFNGASGITSLKLNEGIVTIGPQVFGNMTGLSSINIFPNSLLTINNDAFKNDTSLTTIPSLNKVQTIGANTFYNCYNISGVLNITADVTSIGEGAFANCGFSSIDVSANPSRYHVHDDVLYQESNHYALHSVKGNTGTITFELDTERIGNHCCWNNLRTGGLVIPNKVTAVGESAFQSCSGLTGLSFTPTSVCTILGSAAFQYCSHIQDSGTITLPASCITISSFCFRGATSIDLIFNAPTTLTIGSWCLGGCGNITLEFSSTLETLNFDAYGLGDGTSWVGTLVIPNTLTTLNTLNYLGSRMKFTDITGGSINYPVIDHVLYDKKTSGSVVALISPTGYSGTLTLDTTTTSILSYCFYNNINRTGTIDIPATVTVIGQHAFSGSTGFTALTFSGTPTITTISANAFYNCKELTGTLTLPASLGTTANSIAANAFTGSTVANRPKFTVCNSYKSMQPGAATNAFAFRNASNVSVAIPLHIPVSNSGYDVVPWTNTAIFSSVTADL
jgi:hypothetical protein